MNDPSDRIDRIAKAVRDIGFPSAVAGVLLWAFLVRMPADVDRLQASIDRNTAALSALQEAVRR